MLTIRLQRTGRKGHAQFRLVVQDSRQSPSSGKFVALLGSYNPHTKELNMAKDKAEHYLQHGAQPSDRVARLLKSEGVKLPGWVAKATKKKGTIRNPDKLRKNRPAGAEAPPTKAEKEAAAAEERATEQAVEAEENTAEQATETDNAPAADTAEPAPADAPSEPATPTADSSEDKPAE